MFTLLVSLIFPLQWAASSLDLFDLATSEALWVLGDWVANSLFSSALMHGALQRLLPACPAQYGARRISADAARAPHLWTATGPGAGIYVMQDARLQSDKDELEQQNRDNAAKAFKEMMEQKVR